MKRLTFISYVYINNRPTMQTFNWAGVGLILKKIATYEYGSITFLPTFFSKPNIFLRQNATVPVQGKGIIIFAWGFSTSYILNRKAGFYHDLKRKFPLPYPPLSIFTRHIPGSITLAGQLLPGAGLRHPSKPASGCGIMRARFSNPLAGFAQPLESVSSGRPVFGDVLFLWGDIFADRLYESGWHNDRPASLFSTALIVDHSCCSLLSHPFPFEFS